MHLTRLFGLIAVAVLVIGIGSYFGLKSLPSVEPVHATSETISMVGNLPYWNSSDPMIIVTKGDSVTVVVSGGDAYSHQLLIDFDGDGVSDVGDCGTNDQCSGFVTSTSSSTIPPFTVNTVGDFSYYCTVHHPPAMTGIFRVQNPPPPPSPDFTITSSPTTLAVSPGSSGTTTITLTSLNGFSGKPSLSASVVPSGPQIAIVPTTPTLSSGGTVTAAMTVTTSGSGPYSSPTPAGNYAITIVASNASLSHSATVSLTVGPTSSGNAGLPLGLIAGGVVGGVLIVGVAAYLIRQKSNKAVGR